MREIRQSGSEGGGAETNRLSLPLFGREMSRLQATNTRLYSSFGASL
jgi:hypothetical protein